MISSTYAGGVRSAISSLSARSALILGESDDARWHALPPRQLLRHHAATVTMLIRWRISWRGEPWPVCLTISLEDLYGPGRPANIPVTVD